MSKRQVKFDSAPNKQQTNPSSIKRQQTKFESQAKQKEDDYDFEEFEQESPQQIKNKPQSQQSATAISNKDETQRKVVGYEDIQASTQTNKYIIYKFMKKGFTSLTAEDLACIMINPDFTIDFKKNTNEDWNSQYQFKVIERLNKCKFNLTWATKKQSDDAYDPYFQMVKEGDIGRVVEFLRSSSNLEDVLDAVEKTSKKTALHIAAAEGHTQLCEFLLNKGAKIDARDKLLRTPLHLTCQAGNSTVTKLLLENNADPFDKDSSGRTAMHYATCSSCVEQLVMLTEHGADLVHVKDHAGRTPLHYAVFNSHPKQVEMVLKLLNLGADVNCFDNDRRTPLHHAAESGKARVIPILVQRGASTGTKDSLKNKTSLELAINDHIKELIIVHSSPSYIPKQEDLAQGLSIEGNQLKIEKEPYDIFGMPGTSKKPKPKINKKIQQKQEDSNIQEDDQGYYKPPLGPPKEWEKVQQQWLPYNMKNYQERLIELLKRVQEFGVQSYQHVKKPYLFTGSWMEYVRNLDDLMLQINGTKPNEAVMKMFNIIFPYDKPLPKGKGDELSLQGFYNEREQVSDMKECHPDALRENLMKDQENDTKNVLKNNQVEEIQDLLDIKGQLMTLQQINNMHQITIQEKDERIKQLLTELGGLSNSLNDKKYGVTIEEAEYSRLKSENQELKNQVDILTNQLDQQVQKLEELTQLIEEQDNQKKKEFENVQSISQLKELEIQKAVIEKQLAQEKEKNRALRFKAGQIFLQTLEKGGSAIPINTNSKKKGESDYYLEDDDALMILLTRIANLRGPDLPQRLIDAGELGTGMISRTQFINFLTSINITPADINSLQRIVGFYDGGQQIQKLKISDIMIRIKERADKRAMIEQETLKTLISEFKRKNYTIQDAFQHLDYDKGGKITLEEFQNALNGMKIEIGQQTLRNLIKIFDIDGDGEISILEFENQLSKHLDRGQLQMPTAQQINSKIINEELSKELVKDLEQEVKVSNKFEDFSLKPLQYEELKKQETDLIENLKKGLVQPELISGEIKLQFSEIMNVMQIPGKLTPYVVITINQYNTEGNILPPTQIQIACDKITGSFVNLNKAVRIPLINKDKNKIGGSIQLEVYIQDNAEKFNKDQAVFIGQCEVPWKPILTSTAEFLQQRLGLSDIQNRCTQKVQGMMKVYIKWLPVGHDDSNYDLTGKKKERQAIVKPQDEYRKQNIGSLGQLQIYVNKYTHPSPLPQGQQYYADATLGKNTTKQPAKQASGASIEYYSILNLAVSDSNDNMLTIRFMSQKQGQQQDIELCRTEIDINKLVKDKVINQTAQMDIQGQQEKGTLDMKLKFVTTKIQLEQQQEQQLQKKQTLIFDIENPLAVQNKPKEEKKQSTMPTIIEKQEEKQSFKNQQSINENSQLVVEEKQQPITTKPIQKQPSILNQQQPTIKDDEEDMQINIGNQQLQPEEGGFDEDFEE